MGDGGMTLSLADGHDGAGAARAALVAHLTNACHPWEILSELTRTEQIGAYAFLISALAESLLSYFDGDIDAVLAAIQAYALNYEATA